MCRMCKMYLPDSIDNKCARLLPSAISLACTLIVVGAGGREASIPIAHASAGTGAIFGVILTAGSSSAAGEALIPSLATA